MDAEIATPFLEWTWPVSDIEICVFEVFFFGPDKKPQACRWPQLKILNGDSDFPSRASVGLKKEKKVSTKMTFFGISSSLEVILVQLRAPL